MKMLMEIDPLPMRGSMVMTMVMISPPGGKFSWQNSSARALDWFRLVAAESRPESLLMIFLRRKTSYSRRWAPEGQQGAHEAGGAPGGRARPHPRGQVVAPLTYFFRSVFFIISKNNFRGVSGLLELCRIGL